MKIPESVIPYLERQRTLPKTPEDAVEQMLNEAAVIADQLKWCKTILDIGCGVGVISSALALSGFSVTAFDKTQEKQPREYGWTKDGLFYNSMEAAKDFAKENNAKVRFVEEMPKKKFDAAISLYSWGFHYPLEVYTPNAAIWILDLRRQQEEPEGGITVLSENAKARRILVQR